MNNLFRWMGIAVAAVTFSFGRLSLASDKSTPTTVPATQPAAISADDSELSRIDMQAGKIQNLSAHFEQEKFTPILKKPMRSSGTVRAGGDVIRWDTEKPEPSVLYSNGHEIRIYYPGQKLEEIYPLVEKMSGLLASPLPRMGALRHFFFVQRADKSAFGDLADRLSQNSPVVIRLTPTDDFLKHHVREVAVAIDPNTAMAMAMQTIDADGDRTVMFFSEDKANPGVAGKELEIQIPPGTTVSHPESGDAPPDPDHSH